MGKTRGVHETTPEIRNRMVGMYEAGLGLREIAAAVNCSQRTVKRWLNRFDKEGTVETRDRCGRKRATTQEQDEAIIRLATQTPITAAKAVLPALGLNCSVDTVRERLHKAGIHNWSPSRKHIQKISMAVVDGSGIQQAVWRPTGTQLGKKKSSKEIPKGDTKTSGLPPKKKLPPRKAKTKSSFDEDGAPNANEPIEQQPDLQQNFSFSNLPQNGQVQPQISEMQPMPPPPVPPPLPVPHPVISNNPNQYSHSLNLISQPHPIYHHHPGLNISQNWPLGLGAHHYPQSQPNPIHHEEPTEHIQTHSELHSSQVLSQHDAHLSHIQTLQPPILSQPTVQQPNHQKIDHHVEQHQEFSQLSHEKSNESQDIINVCSDVCSNSSSCNENSQNSSVDDEASNENSSCSSKKRKKSQRDKKKKGGKVKGTLETSVEIRNRMIGMSEAGLSTLSIALAINRSERTVKRWLDRWHKEGNVQTKERKGRRRITTKEQDDAIIAMATQNPLTAAKYVAPALGLKCSVDTIRERLHKAGIHSWKLGKKQGEGNAVHTVHLWQPSGNRSNKVKGKGEKKKSNKKRNQNPEDNSKLTNKKQRPQETSSVKNIVPPTNVMPEESNIQFQNQPQPPPIIQPTHDLSTVPVPAVLAPPPPPPLCPQSSAPSQALQVMGPVMQQRPDCRLALSTIVPQIPSHTSANVTYPSCMMGNTAHAPHMEQTDPMNYEPYIWSF